MDKEELEKTLDDIQLKMVGMRTDLKWIKRILAIAVTIIGAAFGIDLSDTFIQG